MPTDDGYAGFCATHSGSGIAVEDVALPSQAKKHSQNDRWLAGVREQVDSDVEQPGGCDPVVGVVRDEKAVTKPRRCLELGWRVRRGGERSFDPANAFAKPTPYPPELREAGREL